jgi:hypothetical protein
MYLTESQAEATTAFETSITNTKQPQDNYKTNDQLIKEGEENAPVTTLHSCIS